jgi:hypothetical protein
MAQARKGAAGRRTPPVSQPSVLRFRGVVEQRRRELSNKTKSVSTGPGMELSCGKRRLEGRSYHIHLLDMI